MSSSGVLIFGDTERSADLFHAIPVAIIDPFAYAEVGDRRVALVGATDRAQVQGAVPAIEVVDPSALGRDELIADLGYVRTDYELTLRLVRSLGLERVTVPWETPAGIVDHLRAGGIEVDVDLDTFVARRRVKTPHQIEGIRRAADAASAAMARAAALVSACPPGLSCEAIRAAMKEVCAERGAALPDDVIVARNEQAAQGHESGGGSVWEGDVVLIDIWPRDTASRCWADMTRTFVAGDREPSAQVRRWWELSRDALAAVTAAVGPGVNGRALYDIACEVFEGAGVTTQRTKEPGAALDHGFFHALGHGVGIEVHEAPAIGIAGDDLVAGDVVAVEPGCYEPGVGGVRLEDLLLVTDAGAEVLTHHPYELRR